jgi:hypothetical protein
MNILEIVKHNLKHSKKLSESMLLESVGKIEFGGNPYQITVDVTDSPTKMGVRIKFKPMSEVIRQSKEDIASQLQEAINKQLSDSGLMVDSDKDNLEENEISFIMSVSHIQNLIQKAFNSNSTQPDPNDQEPNSEEPEI